MDHTDIIVIGAGAVGLAITARLSEKYSVVVLEKEESFGRHTSSRNSETIHSGIYYPQNTLKATLCLRGNSLLYQFMKENDISHSNCGKYIIASSKDELPEIERLYRNGMANGVPDLRMAEGNEIEKAEPLVRAVAGVYIPTAGIINSHELMKRLETISKENGALFSYRSEVYRLGKASTGYKVTTTAGDSILSDAVFNCAGLFSDRVSEYAGIDIDRMNYRLNFCKGEYYKSDNVKKMNMLIYPVPSPDGRSLGIHNRLFTDGNVAFGPNAYYLDENLTDYSMDGTHREEFIRSVSKFMKSDMSDLSPYDCGIRPKLQKPGEKFRDFVIKNEEGKGLKNFINLVGIESPGLTSCLAIAEYAAELLS
ncbi:MAG TPA: NAD(P)/FAD-dependent oxidoreductase [Spirochaetota bacterium]|nr:NAD(P)/FAD-dependent oxidoreductase [Spirochaetota bacterium]